MNRLHKQRLFFIVALVSTLTVVMGLALYALQQNINLFFSPSQVAAGEAPVSHAFRLGGIVQAGSIRHVPDSLQVSFVVTDYVKRVPVNYTGILPDLFREGQSVVVEGHLSAEKTMLADQVLAKHDEKYMPAAVKDMLRKPKSYAS